MCLLMHTSFSQTMDCSGNLHLAFFADYFSTTKQEKRPIQEEQSLSVISRGKRLHIKYETENVHYIMSSYI